MAKSLEVDIREVGSWKAKDADGRSLSKTLGQGTELSGSTRIKSGTTDGKCNVLYRHQFNLAESDSELLNLRDTTKKDAAGDPLTLAKVRLIRVVIDGGTSLRIGPQDEANGWQGPCNAVDETGYIDVYDSYKHGNLTTGWAVDATHKIFKLLNTGTGAVSGLIEFFGTDA